MTTKPDSAPVSNRKWFVVAVPSDEAIEIAEAWEHDKDGFLREMAQEARKHYERFGPLNDG